MLEVRFRRDSRDRLSSVVAGGHAGFADAGEDIVCAGASAILQAAQLGLAEHARLEIADTRVPGELRLSIAPDLRDREDVRAIVRTAELSIEALARQYPDHVRYLREPEPKENG